MQPGRVALVNTGKFQGKLLVIVDVIDQNRVSCLLAVFFGQTENKDMWCESYLSFNI